MAMRYDTDTERLYISVSELVTLTRRGIARGGAFKDELPPRDAATSLYFDSSIGSRDITLYGEADGLLGGTVTLIRRVEPRGGKVKRADREQARGEGFILAHLLSITSGADTLRLNVIYMTDGGEIILDESEEPTAKSLAAFYCKCISALEKYGRPEIERLTERLPSFKKAKFPYGNIREGQNEFLRAVYRALSRGTRLYASAPTGTGKTVSVLYPAIRALGDGRCDKVFYLTPKHTTADAARDCLDLFATQGVLVRAVVMYAKETLCPCDMACRSVKRSCPYAECKRLADAVLALYDTRATVITRREIATVAEEYSVCPHELSLAYSEVCDAVICDFNYLYDPQVYIKRYFDEGGRYALLVDEAHNLPDRAREMYSEELSLAELTEVIDSPLIGEHSPLRTALTEMRDALDALLFPYLYEELREDADGNRIGAAHLSDMPHEMYTIIDNLAAITEDAHRRALRDEDEDAEARASLIAALMKKARKLQKITEVYDEKYKTFLFYTGGVSSFKLFCVDTGGVIARRTDLCHGAVFFSATLEPIDYYRSLLGADGGTDTLSVGSPFDPSQLSVSIVDKISTRYSERARTTPAVCRTIAAVMSARRGNYMIFCPSFEYLDMLSRAFISKYPKIRTVVQRRDMTAKEKAEFLDEFRAQNDKYLVGFCVLGGIYSEGVDLAGDSLIGAVVVGIGMPQLSYEREAMREYFADRYEAGTEYAYLYPGMNKVFQAAGRVIRREDDRGVIVLIDDRFRDPIYKKSIPALWHGMRYVGDAKELKARIEAFWKTVDEERK